MSGGMHTESDRQETAPSVPCALPGTLLCSPPRSLPVMTGAMPSPEVQQLTSVSPVPNAPSRGPCMRHFSGCTPLPSRSPSLLQPLTVPRTHCAHCTPGPLHLLSQLLECSSVTSPERLPWSASLSLSLLASLFFLHITEVSWWRLSFACRPQTRAPVGQGSADSHTVPASACRRCS